MKTKIRAIHIDDEDRAQRVLHNIINKYCPEVELIMSCSNVPDGVLAIKKMKPDVVFLDIEMPNYSGFELLEFFGEINFEIIFVTAHNDFAIRAFEVSAIDYILKPVRIDQFEKAIEKLKNKMELLSMPERLASLKDNLKTNEINKIAVPVKDGYLFIKVPEISHIDADGSYARIWKIDGTSHYVSKKLKYFEDTLVNNNEFFRAHRSHLLNVNHIKKYTKAEGIISLDNECSIKISREKKAEFESRLEVFKG